ncbi:hypothetical protein LVJ83_10845 [Uruburuella testudinis]|uniref:Uncharacterized protein n=1 Tax=Uruburuella testudinis TaxID=1282863 RepID=A0ABY4DW92_9NEIS|nr:hypothetical protein [Uruburuella testudinis]UOO83299.1 hypothetical protein LVJ83_10845 [Uruburuella testudinis]
MIADIIFSAFFAVLKPPDIIAYPTQHTLLTKVSQSGEPTPLGCFANGIQTAFARVSEQFVYEGFLFLKMQMPGKKRSKMGHLARLFNAADVLLAQKRDDI